MSDSSGSYHRDDRAKPPSLRLFGSLLLLLIFSLAPACGGGNPGTGDGGGNDQVSGNCNGDCKDTEECVQGQFCLPKCGADESRCGSACKNTQSDKEHCGACDKKCADGESCNAGKCEAGKSCADSETKCGDACVDTKTSTDHCGACDAKCASGETCKDGKCETSGCPSGQEDCGGTCVDVSSSSDHCGKCDNKCGTDQSCDSGECKCQGGQTKCGDACVDTDSSDDHCGACDNKCNSPQYCDVGKCVCPSGQENCGGTCVDVSSSDDHCGACDNKCTSPQYCDVGSCVCPNNQTACGASCVDTNTSKDHCGKCDNKCAADEKCDAGLCKKDLTCGTDEEVCDGKCENTKTSTDHCGTCGNKCQTGETCESGSCKSPCTTAGETYCTDKCVNTQTNTDNCGSCGNACATGESCESGSCKMVQACTDTDETRCSGICVNTNTDKNNCGSCGNACASTETCDNGTCAACTTPSKVCNGACVNTNTNPNHCGDCGKACALTETCNSGTCGVCNNTLCGSLCIDTSNDPQHCGGCNKACQNTETCNSGTCTACTKTVCNGACIDTQGDNNNCGTCGTVCVTGKECKSGTCTDIVTCTSSQKNCSGVCKNTQTDNDHCGACNNKCATGESCQSGTCTAGCKLTTCSGKCVDTQTDNSNCGACGTTCTTNQSCVSGTCKATWAAALTGGANVNTRIDSLTSNDTNTYMTGLNSGNTRQMLLTKFKNSDGTKTDISVTLPAHVGFHADLSADQDYTNTNWNQVKNWRTSGLTGLYNVGGAFNDANGEFTAPADGYYLFSARLRFDKADTAGNQIEALLAINGAWTNYNGTFTRINTPKRFETMVTEGVLKLAKGQKVTVRMRCSSDTSCRIQTESGFSGYYIGANLPYGFLVNMSGGSGTLLGNGWRTVKGWKTSSTTNGEKHLFVNGGGFAASSGVYTAPEAGFYYFTARPLFRDAHGSDIQAFIGVNGSGKNGDAGLYNRVTGNANNRRTVPVSGVIKLDKGDKVSLYVNSSKLTYVIQKDSGFGGFYLGPTYTAFNADKSSGQTFTAKGWQQVKGFRTSSVAGLFDQSNRFDESNGEFTANIEGYYYFSATAVVNDATSGTGQYLRLLLAHNGSTDLNRGLHAIVDAPRNRSGLHVNGLMYLKSGEKVTMRVYSHVDTSWSIGAASSFSAFHVAWKDPALDGRAVATDSNDNLYVTGNIRGLLNLGNPYLTGGRSYVAKRKSDGTWEKTYAAPIGVSSDIAVDGSGNVFLCGKFRGSWTYATGKTLTGTGRNGYIGKYNSSGVPQWFLPILSADNSYTGPKCSVAGSGEVYVAGLFQGKLTLGSITLNSAAATGTFYYLARVKADGSGFEWAKEFSAGVTVDHVAAGSTGNAYIVGTFNKTLTVGNTTLTSPNKELFVMGFDKTGNVSWSVKSQISTNNIRARDIYVAAGKIYIAGDFNGKVKLGNTDLTTKGKYDALLAALDGSGKVLWVKQAGGSEDDWYTHVCADTQGNYYYGGVFRTATLNFGPRSVTRTSTGNYYDTFVTKNLP